MEFDGALIIAGLSANILEKLWTKKRIAWTNSLFSRLH